MIYYDGKKSFPSFNHSNHNSRQMPARQKAEEESSCRSARYSINCRADVLRLSMPLEAALLSEISTLFLA
jgi:hypothetical protein